jgi:hypothetical protein
VSIVHENAAAAVGNNIAYTTPYFKKISGDKKEPDQNPKHNEHLNSSLKKSSLDKKDLNLLRIDPYFNI